MNAPSVLILLTYEDRPRVVYDFASDGEQARWIEWAAANPRVAGILDALALAVYADDDEFRDVA